MKPTSALYVPCALNQWRDFNPYGLDPFLWKNGWDAFLEDQVLPSFNALPYDSHLIVFHLPNGIQDLPADEGRVIGTRPDSNRPIRSRALPFGQPLQDPDYPYKVAEFCAALDKAPLFYSGAPSTGASFIDLVHTLGPTPDLPTAHLALDSMEVVGHNHTNSLTLSLTTLFNTPLWMEPTMPESFPGQWPKNTRTVAVAFGDPNLGDTTSNLGRFDLMLRRPELFSNTRETLVLVNGVAKESPAGRAERIDRYLKQTSFPLSTIAYSPRGIEDL